MISLFRRNDAPEPVDEPTSTAADAEDGKAQTPGKGRPTRKRSDATRRRVVQTPPKDNKEARKRMREQMRKEREQAYEGAKRGDEKYLPRRDQGAERRLVRDVVDARRNIGPWFFAGTFLVVLGSLQSMPLFIRTASTALWLFMILAMVVDAFLITRRIKRIVRKRLPKYEGGMSGLYFYGIMRSVVFRRWRSPAPMVELGDEV